MSTGAPEGEHDVAAAKPPHSERPPSKVVGLLQKWIERHGGITVLFITVIGFALAGVNWISEKFAGMSKELSSQMTEVRREIAAAQKDAQKDVADVRTEVGKQSTKLDQIDGRLIRLEGRMDAKFGADSPDAPAPGPWSPEHVTRRSKFCEQRCKQDVPCRERCVADYNLCGIRCPTNPISTCFTACVDALHNVPNGGP